MEMFYGLLDAIQVQYNRIGVQCSASFIHSIFVTSIIIALINEVNPLVSELF